MRSALLLCAAVALVLLAPSHAFDPQPLSPPETLEELCNGTDTSYEPPSDFLGTLEFLEIPDVVVAYYRFGNTSTDLPAIVMIVGFSDTMNGWPISILNDLAQDQEVIIFDNRGQGYSRDTNPDMPLSILSMANDTKNFVEALELSQPPHLMGWSMGGMITLTASAVFGDSFNRFAVFSGSAGSLQSQLPSSTIVAEFSSSEPMTRVERLAYLFPLNTTAGVAAACKFAVEMQYSPYDPSNEFATNKQLDALIDYFFSNSTMDLLPETERHVMVVGGLWDDVVPAQDQKLASKTLPYAWMTIFQDGKHAAFIQHWDTVFDVLKVFLDMED